MKISFRWLKIFLWLFVLFPSTLLQAQEDEQEQQEAVAEEAVEGTIASDETFFRYSILTEMNAVRFNLPHPFRQMTGSSVFDDPNASPQAGLTFGLRIEGQEDNGKIQSFLRSMPPFSIEYVIPTDFFFINGMSFMYYHMAVAHFDSVVAGKAAGKKSRTPLIKMITYFDFVTASVHFFHPREEGVDIFVGLGVVNIDGAYEGGFRGRPENKYVRTTDTKNFDAFPVFIRRIGMDVNGEFFGLRFGMFLFDKEGVITDNVFVGNPLTPKAKESITFQGLVLRAALTFHF